MGRAFLNPTSAWVAGGWVEVMVSPTWNFLGVLDVGDDVAHLPRPSSALGSGSGVKMPVSLIS